LMERLYFCASLPPKPTLDKSRIASAVHSSVSFLVQRTSVRQRHSISRHFRPSAVVFKFTSRRFFEARESAVRCVITSASMAPKDLWKQADAVSFDVDSTLCKEESIDVLAEIAGVGEQVAELTRRGMDGSIAFQDALAQRLKIIQPSVSLIERYMTERPPILSPHVRELIELLVARNVKVFLVSGGFRAIIEPIAKDLGLHPHDSVFANTILYGPNGEYVGFDTSEFTSKKGGKAQAMSYLKEHYKFKTVVHIGDGATDLEAKPPADLIIGYGGVVKRPLLVEKADWFVHDFSELIEALK